MSARGAATLALGGIVLAAAAIWGALGQQLDVPTVFGDELIHWDASRSLAAGDGLRVRDGGYGFAPGYPALLAPVHLLTENDLSAYGWARLLNALCFALAAIPAYALARRLLAPSWSLACAALAVGIPSALYTGFVMTGGRRLRRVHAGAPRVRALPRATDRRSPSSPRSARWRSRRACGCSSRRSAPRSCSRSRSAPS